MLAVHWYVWGMFSSSLYYVGRGSGTPCLDVFITLLSLGWDGYRQLCTQRKVSSCQFLPGPTLGLPLGFQGGTRGCKAHMSELWLLDLSPLQENYLYLKERLSEVCSRHGERVLDTPHNPISLGGGYAVYGAIIDLVCENV